MHPMALKVERGDAFRDGDVSDLLHCFCVQIHKAARIDDLKPSKLACYTVKHGAVERKIGICIA